MHCAYVIALLVGYIALSLGNDWGDSRRSSDEANVLLPNNKLILYGEVSSSWLDMNYLLMHVNTCTCIFTHNNTYTYIHKAHSLHTQMIVVSNVMNQNHDVQQSQGPRV